MIDFLSLAKKTGAYKIAYGDKENGRLSHAYLVVCSDDVYLKEYLKVFAKLIACKNTDPCDNCRACRLIDEEKAGDVIFYPTEKKALSTEDVNALIEESFIKPIELDKKIFVITATEPMSTVVQNKLLKTLEEPPKGVHIIIGATSEYGLLPTLLSRVRKIEIPSFPEDVLFNALKGLGDSDSVREAVVSSTGTVGNALSLLGDENFKETVNAVIGVLSQMKSSKDVLKYSGLVSSLKGGFNQFLSVLELTLADIMRALVGGDNKVKNPDLYQKVKDSGFNIGSIVYALEKVNEATKRKKFNANSQMLTEWLLFQILEGKFKWRKS